MRPVCISLLLLSFSASVWALPEEAQVIDRTLAVCLDRSDSDRKRLDCLDEARDDWEELVEELSEDVDDALLKQRLHDQQRWHLRLDAQWQSYRTTTLTGIAQACGQRCLRNQLETDLELLRQRAQQLAAELAALVPASAR